MYDYESAKRLSMFMASQTDTKKREIFDIAFQGGSLEGVDDDLFVQFFRQNEKRLGLILRLARMRHGK